MSNDNTRDAAEPSLASAGSHVELHRAVRALLDGVNARYAKNPREWTCPHMQALDDMTQSEPQPTLTDAEWDEIEGMVSDYQEIAEFNEERCHPHYAEKARRRAAMLIGLLERLG